MVIFRKIGLLLLSSTLCGIAIVDAFLLQNSILDGEGTWASIFFSNCISSKVLILD